MKSVEIRGRAYTIITKHLFAIWLLLWFTSCIKNEVQTLSDNVMMKQSFSIPLGTKELHMDAPSVYDTSSVPGAYGKFYYNGLPYAANSPNFPPLYDTVNLNLTNKTQVNWITRITFSIVSENSFPSQDSLQVNLLDANGVFLDEAFGNKAVFIDSPPTDANGNVISPTTNITEVVYEGARLDLLKQTKIMQYKVLVSANPQKILRLSDANNFKVTIGARIELLYNIKDITK